MNELMTKIVFLVADLMEEFYEAIGDFIYFNAHELVGATFVVILICGVFELIKLSTEFIEHTRAYAKLKKSYEKKKEKEIGFKVEETK